MDIKQYKIASAITSALAGLDPCTLAHSHRVQRICLMIGKNMGLSSKELTTLSLGSLLHDVGKQYIPQAILMKKEALLAEEWTVIQQHPLYGYDYAKNAELHGEIEAIILHHHLWFNGQGGYPHNGSEVRPSLLTQITTVADVVDAMTQDRPYREALTLKSSLAYLEEKSGTQFSPDVVRCLTAHGQEIADLIGH